MTNLSMIERGQGDPALVFLHFFGGSTHSWTGMVTALSDHYRCIALDLCGFGASGAPGHAYAVADHRNDVLASLDALHLQKFILIGHSMGGKIALSVAAQQPRGLAGLLLIAPSPPTPEPGSPQERADFLNMHGDRLAIEKLVRKITVQPLEAPVFNQTVTDHLRINLLAWRSWIEIGSQENIASAMTRIHVPVQVVSGAQDPVFSTRFLQRELGKYFSEAIFTEVPATGHLLPLEAVGKMAEIVMNYKL